MSTLREAVTKAANEAECKNPAASWAGVFIASLRQSGYWIAPVNVKFESHENMVLDGMKASLLGRPSQYNDAYILWIYAAMRDAYIKESGQ